MRAGGPTVFTLVVIGVLLGCCGVRSRQTHFDAARWRDAQPSERREMAGDFLKTHDVKTLTVDKIQALLGEPDYEDDRWCYAIGLDSKATDDTHVRRVPRDLELCVSFKEDIVSAVGLTYTVRLISEVTFDSARWKVSQSAERMRMARSLIDSQILLHKTKRAVEQMLGTPDRKSDTIELGYDLGLRMIDHVYLVFSLDAERRVVGAKVVEH